MLDLQLQDAVVLITGGASGIGEAAARGFAQQGAAVILLDRQYSQAETLATALNAEGAMALAVNADVTDETAIAKAVEQIIAWQGKLDIVLCCAGISGPVGVLVPDIAPPDWEKVIAVNLNGLFYTARNTVPWLEQSSFGGFIVLASDSSFLAYPGMAPYSVAKAGALMFAKALAVDHPKLRVNCICPSVVNTPMSRADLGLTTAQMQEAGFPVIIASQLVNHILFMASPLSSPMNATSVVVDFGYMAKPSFPQPDFIK